MPCLSSEGMGADIDYQARAAADRATRVACDILTSLEAAGINLNLSEETRRWWEAHRTWDQQRRDAENMSARREEMKRVALSKLTPEEIAALGFR